MKFKLTPYNLQELGQRQNQEDSLFPGIGQQTANDRLFILCDGMGGLDKGEVASASVIRAFDAWVHNELPALCEAPIEDSVLRTQWDKIVTEQNNLIP